MIPALDSDAYWDQEKAELKHIRGFMDQALDPDPEPESDFQPVRIL